MAERRNAAGAEERRGLWALALTAGWFVIGFTGSRMGREQLRRSETSEPLAHHSGRRGARSLEQQAVNSAASPTEIPARGWLQIAKRVVREIGRDRVMSVAAGVTFYLLLAMFPAMVAFLSLYGMVADPQDVTQQLEALSGVLPDEARGLISEQLIRIAGQTGGALGVGFFIGLGVALWSANAGMKAIFDALNVVYDEEEKRGFVKLTAITLLFTIGGILFLILALLGVTILPVILEFLGLEEWVQTLFSYLRWPVLLLLLVIAISIIYRFGPSRAEAKWRWITPGSVLAAVIWVVASILFSWYLSNLANFNETYGSLGAVIAFMMWLWISSIIILTGAELNAEMEHQTTLDSTAGPDQPMGRRGAVKADTAAASA